MSPKSRTLIIAEAGVNHNGDIKLAKLLVDAAANAGANLVKFQTFNAELLATEAAPKAKYQTQTTDAAQSQVEMLSDLELSPQSHEALVSHCLSRGIDFSSGFDIQILIIWFLLGLIVSKYRLVKSQICPIYVMLVASVSP